MGQTPSKPNWITNLEVSSRVLAAIVGGYVLSSVLAVLLTHLLPTSKADSVMAATQASYAIYAVIVIWVFTTETATQAWRGLIITATASCVAIGILTLLSKVFS